MYPTVSSCSFPPFYSCGFPIWHWPITGVTMGKMGLTPHPHPLVSTCNPSITSRKGLTGAYNAQVCFLVTCPLMMYHTLALLGIHIICSD